MDIVALFVVVMRTFLSGRKGRRDVPGRDQERVLITFHHKEERRGRMGGGGGDHGEQEQRLIHCNQPNHFPS